MINIFGTQPEGWTYDTTVGEILKNHFFFVEGYLIKKSAGWPVAYFIARGLQSDNCPTDELSLYIAVTSRIHGSRIKIQIRRETERPNFLDCPAKLLEMVERSPIPHDIEYSEHLNAICYRQDVREAMKVPREGSLAVQSPL